MINGIVSNSQYLHVNDGNPSRPYISPGTVGAGMVRYNPNIDQLEVNDGNAWISYNGSYATIELTPEMESLLDWAREKREEERKLEAMMEQYPALRKAKENFDILLNLTKDDYRENA